MIADNVQKIEKHPDDSNFFEITFADDSTIIENECNWSTFSTEKMVRFSTGTKIVRTCDLAIKSIRIVCGEMETTIEVEDGQEVFQYMKGSTTFMPNGEKFDRFHGRGIGIIEDGRVIEERYLNLILNEVTGYHI